MKRLVVLISGTGTNLQALLQACREPHYGAQVVAVGADRECDGLNLARNVGIPTFIVPLEEFPTRGAWDQELTRQTDQFKPDLVISAGFLKLVGDHFLTTFHGKFINTHNSLLPAFPGTKGPKDALDYGVKITGATLFLVDQGLDTGVIISQVAVPVKEDDTVETLTERIKDAERNQLVESVGAMVRNGWRVSGRRFSFGGVGESTKS